MNKLKAFCTNNSWFLLPSAAAIIAGLILYIMEGQIGSHMLLNGLHTPLLDRFFEDFTYIGGGFPSYLGIFFLLFVSLRSGLYILLSQGVGTLITHAIKFSVAAPRPVTLFAEKGLELPPTVEGLFLNPHYSFPSGHTMAIFALCMCLSAMLPKKYSPWGIAFSLIAILGAYSRVYLSQHFLEDLLLGAVIGICTAAALYIWLYDKKWMLSDSLFALGRNACRSRRADKKA